MDMTRLLPTGIQDFADIRERGFCYVDKTAHIHQLISGSGKPFFLSRPRRFGKSLLCSTLRAVFEGRRELFGEIAGQPALAINSLKWGWEKHPVIKIDLNAGVYSNGVEALHSALSRELKREARKQKLVLDDDDCTNQFACLIERSCEKNGQKAVVIIDEYDKPLLETADQPLVHEQIRKELKGLYGVLKSYDEYLRFVFITGVTKFSHVSIFSDLNHLDDLTLDPAYADICGLTQEELEQNFEPEIEAILNKTSKGRDEYIDSLRRFYNGYRFSEKPQTAYNPFGILHHLKKAGKFLPYWYETGSPDFLINLVANKKVNITELGNMRVGYENFREYDIESMEALPVLYQTGYLTISDYDEEEEEFILDHPNLEVRSSFAKSLIKQYLKAPDNNANALISKLPKAFKSGDVECVIEVLRPFLAAIPYDIIKKTENYYETAVFLIFRTLGLDCRAEVQIADGRIDTIVETSDFVYCFEFKIDKSAEVALAQINTKEYLLPWTGSGKKLFKIGVNFDSEKRNIGGWKYETVNVG
jgi:hypothetical protein